MERAKSSRGTCKAKGKPKKCTETQIEKGELRCGWLDGMSGAYGGWTHLDCWRVPSKIWLGLPDPDECNDDEILAALVHMNEVTFCGLRDLNKDEKAAVVKHIKNKEHWARKTKSKKPKVELDESIAQDIVVSDSAVSSSDIVPLNSTSVAKTKQRFLELFPGKDGAIPDALKGKTVVLTGVFPEVGGGGTDFLTWITNSILILKHLKTSLLILFSWIKFGQR